MHKIIPGVANRSYGIQVAKMAGMPASVVSRAEAVLAGLETHNETLRDDIPPSTRANGNAPRNNTNVSQPKNTKVQLNLFG